MELFKEIAADMAVQRYTPFSNDTCTLVHEVRQHACFGMLFFAAVPCARLRRVALLNYETLFNLCTCGFRE